jgi:hypothetical protein
MSAPDAQPAQPPETPTSRPRAQLWTNLIILFLLVGVAGGLWLVWWRPDPLRDPQFDRGGDYQPEDPTELRGTMLVAKQRMDKLAESMRNYREQFGDGVRWPMTLEDLKFVQLLPQEYELNGVLSRRPLTYAPEVPAGFDPTRWAICCDVEPAQRSYRGARAPGAAVVILGDGSVRVLQGDELTKIGGIVYDNNAPR